MLREAFHFIRAAVALTLYFAAWVALTRAIVWLFGFLLSAGG